MLYINLIAMASIVLFAVAYVLIRNSYVNKQVSMTKLSNQMIIFLMVVIALIIRIICAFNFKNHADLECFEYWGNVAYEHGFGNFYENAGNADYPPGYMYVLWFLTVIKNMLKLKNSSVTALMLIKTVPIICDIVTGIFLYKISAKKFNSVVSHMMLFVYLFNPGVILNSAVWGQVDSVFMLGILLMVYYAMSDKSYLSYVAYFIAILIKPQAIMFTPIIMFVFVQKIFINSEGKKLLTFRINVFFEHMAWIISTLCGFALICMPFGLVRVLKQYVTTMGSYEYASVNAYNFWSMFGLNWKSQEERLFGVAYKDWGTIVILAICLIALFIWISKLEDKKRYITIAIFICVSMFTFSVRMHERYVYPAVILLLLLFIESKHISVLILYFAYSVAHFYNVAHVLYFYDYKNFDPRIAPIILIGLLHVILYVFLFRYVYRNYMSSKCDTVKNTLIDKFYSKKQESEDDTGLWTRIKMQFDRKEVQRSKIYEKFTKKDIIFIVVLTIVYAAFALYDLGDRKAPESMWEMDKTNRVINIELDETTPITGIAYYNGNWQEVEYTVNMAEKKAGKWTYSSDTTAEEKVDVEQEEYKSSDKSTKDDKDNKDKDSKDKDSKEEIQEVDNNSKEVTDEESSNEETSNEETSEQEDNNTSLMMDEVFCWNKWDFDNKAKYIQLIVNESEADATIGELIILSGDKIIKPKNSDDKELKGLFDEQDMLPKEFSFRNSTYFDEIYHARTAYEFIHGITTYEWTHPPLGKWFISLGVRMFGMCPFGWRIIGTIFGILMVPLIYIFAKRIFGKTYIATFACIMMTFDFMHLAQTRIATIDVYVTFFVILMYYFMYKYYEMSFYDTKLLKTFIPLLLSGISMGLGIASKWTGCYAAVGLAIIFFTTVGKRTNEYKLAKTNPEGATNGIKHSVILQLYKGNLIKTIAFCFVAFIGIPFIIYVASYIPFIGDENCPNTALGKMIYNQKMMFTYHTNVEFEHGYSSRWYEWPLMIRPIFYFSGASDAEFAKGMSKGISSFGNPLVWWLGIAAFIYVCYRLFAKKDRSAWFFFVGYLAQLLPWILVERLTFIYHYFPSVPFVVLMNAYMIYKLAKDKQKNIKYIVIYGALVIAVFVLFYPVLSGKPVSVSYVDNVLRWVDSWVLISG